MKKNIWAVFVFGVLVVSVFSILVYKADLLPTPSKDFQKSLNQNMLNENIAQNQGESKTIQEKQLFQTDDFEFMVISSSISKELRKLKKVNTEDYVVGSDVKVDKNNKFLDDHFYLQVELSIKNKKNETYPIELPNIQLLAEVENELRNITDISLTDFTIDTSKKDSFHMEIKPGEQKELFIGYVLTAEQSQQVTNQGYILPDFSGVFLMDPQQLTKIKLNVERG